MKKLIDLIGNAKRAAIAGHENPDGDCAGSCLALYNYLKEAYPGLETDVYLEKLPASYSFLAGSEEIKGVAGTEPYDLFFALDSGDRDRIGIAGELFDTASLKVCVDHHISNVGFADVNIIVPSASSTSELIYELIEQDGGVFTHDISEALYLGIIQDTGVFQYSCTGPRTMEIAGNLIRKGIDFTKIIEETFFQKTFIQNRLLGEALASCELTEDGKSVYSVTSLDQLAKYNADSSDLDGIVSQLRETKGVDLAIFLYEKEPGSYKVSMRSSDAVDVSAIALKLGGGGHKKAAGCSAFGTSREIIENILSLAKAPLKS